MHIFQKKTSTKRGHLIAQVHNTAVKWSIKPYIFRTTKVSKILKKADQDEDHAIKDLLQCIMSSEYRRKKGFYKTWTFDLTSQKYLSEMVYQNMHW